MTSTEEARMVNFAASKSKSKKKRQIKLLAILISIIVLVAATLVGFSFFKKPKPIESEKIVSVERGNIARSVVATGKIEPLYKIEVKSKANGIIKAFLVNVGERVKAGQVLVELDKETIEARVRESRANLEATEANLSAATAAESRSRIEAMNPSLEFARREYERKQTLWDRQVISQQQLDDARKLYELAKNEHALRDAAIPNAVAQVKQARARVSEATAALNRVEEELRNTTITAPVDGVVLTRDREVGDSVSSIQNLGSFATLVMTLGDVSTVYVKGEIDEADVGKIKVGLLSRTTIESFPGRSFEGVVTRIAPLGLSKDNVTTFEVRVSVMNLNGNLRVNMSANSEIIIEERNNVLLVSESAITREKENTAYVRILDPAADSFHVVAVKIGLSNGQRTEIIEGLKETDRLVLP